MPALPPRPAAERISRGGKLELSARSLASSFWALGHIKYPLSRQLLDKIGGAEAATRGQRRGGGQHGLCVHEHARRAGAAGQDWRREGGNKQTAKGRWAASCLLRVPSCRCHHAPVWPPEAQSHSHVPDGAQLHGEQRAQRQAVQGGSAHQTYRCVDVSTASCSRWVSASNVSLCRCINGKLFKVGGADG